MRRIFVKILKISFFSFLFFTCLSLLLFLYFLWKTPEPMLTEMLSAPQSSFILDRHGELLYEVHGDVRRTPIALSNIPEYLKEATIVTEDNAFYQHFGFDPLAILRAAYINIKHGEVRQGASTITQQLTRTIFLNNEISFYRKIKELFLAVRIDYKFEKDFILELYLNNIPYGSNTYGVEAASQHYFGKSVVDLSLRESAYLAALPKAPSDYSPFGPNLNDLHKRAFQVLNAMYAEGYIGKEELSLALYLGEIDFDKASAPIRAPHFVFYLLDYLLNNYSQEDLETKGLRIYSSLDLDLQVQAEEIISEKGAKNEEKYQAGNAALVALDFNKGEVLAMVGSRDYFRDKDGAVNVVTSLRQPGSSFKPYVYAAALAEDFTAASTLYDYQTDFARYNNGVSYVPRNYNGRYYGPISLRRALAGSLNIPAVKVLVSVGIDDAIDLAERFGLSSLSDRDRFGPSLVLGGAEVTLLEHTAGLGIFGNGGVRQQTNPVLKILGNNQSTIYQRASSTGEQVIDPQTAYLLNDILSDTNARRYVFGAGTNLVIPGYQVAVKTGTTQEFRDAWTVGYSSNLAVGVWVGNNDNSPMKEGANGYMVAAPIWNEFMRTALPTGSLTEFARPAGIKELLIDNYTGGLATRFSSSTRREIFTSFNNPSKKSATGNFFLASAGAQR